MTEFSLTVEVINNGSKQSISFKGRDAWALNELMLAGTTDVTSLTHPAPRWSAYVHKLRKAGIAIETRNEAHRGRFPGTHGRYVLMSSLRVLEAV